MIDLLLIFTKRVAQTYFMYCLSSYCTYQRNTSISSNGPRYLLIYEVLDLAMSTAYIGTRVSVNHKQNE